MNRRGLLALSGVAAAGLVAGAVTIRRTTLPAPSLQPHFAYGELARDEYRATHIFHVRNQFDEITIV